MDSKKSEFLRLVWDRSENRKVESNDSVKKDPFMQMDLFSSKAENSILIVYLADIDGKMFSTYMENIHPQYVIDMRVNPRFDIPGYSRKQAFAEFNKIGTKYIDYIDLLGNHDKNKEHILSAVKQLFLNSISGPLAILFSEREKDELYEEELLQIIPKDKEKWGLSVIPN